MSRIILVPVDFTKASQAAFEHAAVIAKALPAEIQLLHIVGNKKDIEDARLRMNTLLEKWQGKNKKIKISFILRIGSIFEDIDHVAAEIGASLVIMGTHGKKGMQFLSGSRALKIVTESSVPFIIVQEKGIGKNGYNKIVVPLDLNKETKQKLNNVCRMAEYFQSEILLVSPNEKDEFLRNQLERNISFAKNMLDEQNIRYTTTITESKSSNNFIKELLKFAEDEEADMICIMNLYENSLMGMLGSSYEEQIITNKAQIPVMCVNPIETFVIDGPFSS